MAANDATMAPGPESRAPKDVSLACLQTAQAWHPAGYLTTVKQKAKSGVQCTPYST